MVFSLSFCYRLIVSIIALYLPFRYKKVDLASRMVCFLVWLGFVTEALGYCTAKYYHNNYPVLNTSFYIEFIFIALYYNYSLPVFRKKNLGIYIAAGGVLLGLLNTIFLQPFKTVINSNLLFLECLLVVCLSLFSIYKMLSLDRDDFHLHRKVHFWFACILLFYQCAALSSWGLYDKLGDNAKEKGLVLDVLVLSINIITYLSYGTVFLFYPKLKLVYDEI